MTFNVNDETSKTASGISIDDFKDVHGLEDLSLINLSEEILHTLIGS